MKEPSHSATFRAHRDAFVMVGFYGDAQAPQLVIPELSEEPVFISMAEL